MSFTAYISKGGYTIEKKYYDVRSSVDACYCSWLQHEQSEERRAAKLVLNGDKFINSKFTNSQHTDKR